jgi:ABC-type polysaccharide/polyol phosphate transport system ATPase subunit
MTKIIEIENLNLHFPIYGQKKFIKRQTLEKLGGNINQKGNSYNVHALKNINLTINKGEKVGFIGHNGAGKSTLLTLIYGVYKQDTGSIRVSGKLSAIFSPVAAMDLELSGIINIYRLGLLLGETRESISIKLEQIIKDSKLENFVHLPVRSYSSGMRLRLGFSVIINTVKDIILIDEMITVGDAEFKNYAYEKIKNAASGNCTLLIATHSKNLLLQFTERLIVMNKGMIIDDGNTEEMLIKYKI